MAESTEKPAERKRWRLSPIMTSAFALTVLTAMFLLQGRAYREGWLGHFGLENAQFPISTTDTYWLALHGWFNTAIGWFKNAWDIYFGHLAMLFLPLALFAFVTLALEWRKANKKLASERESEDDRPPENKVQQWLAAGGRKAWIVRGVVSLVIAPISLAAFPLMMFVAGLLLATLIAIAVAPFENIGTQAAIDFCKRPVIHAAKIVLTEGAGHPEWGYRIECNANVCAMIRDGTVYVVPTRDIQRIELPAAGTAVEKSAESGQDQLCPTPDDSAAVPA